MWCSLTTQSLMPTSSCRTGAQISKQQETILECRVEPLWAGQCGDCRNKEPRESTPAIIGSDTPVNPEDSASELMLILSIIHPEHRDNLLGQSSKDLMFGNLRSGALNTAGALRPWLHSTAVSRRRGYCNRLPACSLCQFTQHQSSIARSPSPDISVDNGDLRPFAPQKYQCRCGVIASYAGGPFVSTCRGCFRNFSEVLRSADSLPESRQADYNAALQVHEDSLCT